MTDATLKILIDGLVPAAGAIAALTAAIGAVAALRRQNTTNSKLNEFKEETGTKLNGLKEETGKIHTLTNSTASELSKAYQVLIEKSLGQDREIAALKEDKKDRKEEAVRAEQSSATAAARALPLTDAHIVNGGKIQPAQSDRIETTGSNTKVIGDRVDEVEEKLDEEKDK